MADDIIDMVRLRNNDAAHIFDAVWISVSSAFSGRSNGTFGHYILRGLGPAYFSLLLNQIILFIFYWIYVYSVFRFIHALSTYFLGLGLKLTLAVSLTIVFLSINHMRSPAEGFFWYSGVVNYTLMYSFILLLTVNVMDLYYNAQINKIKLYIKHIISVLFIFFICGSQTAGGILTVASLMALCFFDAIASLRNKTRPRKYFIYLYATVAGIFLLLNVLGSVGRMEFGGGGMTAGNALVHSLYHAGLDVLRWHLGLTVVLLILILPLLATRIQESKKIQFAHPVMACAVLLVLYVAMYVPAFYGLGGRGPARLIDFHRNMSYVFAFMAFCYMVGYLTVHKNIIKNINKWKYKWMICAGVLLLILIPVRFMPSVRGNFHEGARQFASGQIAQYTRIMAARQSILENAAAKNIEFAAFPHGDLIVFDKEVMELKDYATHWMSVSRSRLHDKDSLIAVDNLEGRIFRVVSAPIEWKNPGDFFQIQTHYIRQTAPVRENIIDITGLLPLKDDGTPFAHSEIKLAVASRESGAMYAAPVFPVMLDNGEKKAGYFSVALDFAKSDGVEYTLGMFIVSR
ncbi:MAG: hypothetical protein FWB88_13265 [Defluviitaleaceae bacterium]|nr:hypothetical protein [Defluviitaleaceae bacterium]MCL2240852.1 hypothetical protein [Defluviitaleaceae bacterium]